MFFKTIMRFVIFNRPVWFQVSWELEKFTIFIEFTFWSISSIFEFFNLIIAMGRLADLTSLASMAIPSLMVIPCFSNWRRISELIWFIASFDNLILKRENVEWSGEGLLKESRKNFLKDSRSFIWFSNSGSELMWNHFCNKKHLNSNNGG